MKYLLDTDHISILQQQSGLEYATLMSRIAQHTLSEPAFSIISFHEQVLVVRARAGWLFQQRLESLRDFWHLHGVFNGLGNDDAVTLALRFNVSNQLLRLLAPRIVQADDDHITLLDQQRRAGFPASAGDAWIDREEGQIRLEAERQAITFDDHAVHRPEPSPHLLPTHSNEGRRRDQPHDRIGARCRQTPRIRSWRRDGLGIGHHAVARGHGGAPPPPLDLSRRRADSSVCYQDSETFSALSGGSAGNTMRS